MIFADSIAQKCVGIASDPASREDVIRFMVELAMNHPALAGVKADMLFERMLERENLQSTALGDRIAIPHCRLPGIADFATGVLVVPDGVDFGAPNGEKTQLFVFVVAPEERTDEHIRLLSQISRTLMVKGTVERLLSTPADGLFAAVLASIPDRDIEVSGPMNQVTLIVAGESRFLPLLEVVAGIPQSRVWTQSIQSSRTYLERVPLFAAFSGDVKPREYRMICVVVPRSLSNALLRAVDEFCGPLAECRDVLVTIRELIHTAGALEL